MHRTANWNEESGRYSELSSDFYVPSPDQWRVNTAANRQATVAGDFDEKQKGLLHEALVRHQAEAYELYQALLWNPGDEGEPDWDRVYNDALAGLPPLARELARMVLPVNIYTRWVWKIDLKNLFHFLKLRLDSHAQHEIQVYGQVIDKFVNKLCPAAHASWMDNDVNSLHLSGTETLILGKILAGSTGHQVFGLCRAKLWSRRRFNEFSEKVGESLLFNHGYVLHEVDLYYERHGVK